MDSWEGGQDRCEKPFMMAQVIQGLRSYWELTGSERTADQIYGMADFILDESSLGPWGFNYVVLIDPERNPGFLAARRAEADRDGKHVSYGHLAWVPAWVHRHFGDRRFRTVIDGIDPRAYPYVSRAYTGYYPERADDAAPEAVRDLAARSLDDGKVQLSWTTPAGEPSRYQVKWADKPLVERLDFPEAVSAAANWWAANHVAGEPRPKAAGIQESMLLGGVSAGKKYFALRSFDAASNRSELSNMAEISVR
jgi:hypothetical protein